MQELEPEDIGTLVPGVPVLSSHMSWEASFHFILLIPKRTLGSMGTVSRV